MSNYKRTPMLISTAFGRPNSLCRIGLRPAPDARDGDGTEKGTHRLDNREHAVYAQCFLCHAAPAGAMQYFAI